MNTKNMLDKFNQYLTEGVDSEKDLDVEYDAVTKKIDKLEKEIQDAIANQPSDKNSKEYKDWLFWLNKDEDILKHLNEERDKINKNRRK